MDVRAELVYLCTVRFIESRVRSSDNSSHDVSSFGSDPLHLVVMRYLEQAGRERRKAESTNIYSHVLLY